MADTDEIYAGIIRKGREAQRRFVDLSLSLDAGLWNGN
ncbi:unnamed protein product, partial [marine sediment metagenome]